MGKSSFGPSSPAGGELEPLTGAVRVFEEYTNSKSNGGGVAEFIKDVRVLPPKNSIILEEDLVGQTPAPVYLANNTELTLGFNVEVIPIIEVNNITSLASLTQRNIWNKQKFFENSTVSGDGVYATELNYYLNKIGGTNGFSDYEGVVGGELITVEMPPVSAITTYEVYITGGVLGYDMPTKELPWVINQLIDITTTINFNSEDTDHYTVGDNLVITAPPQAMLNSNGTRDVDISVTRVSSELYEFSAARKDAYGTGEHNSSVSAFDILPLDSGSLPDIIATDLVASINATGTVASIKGTITIGKSTIESVSLLFQPSFFFAIQ